MSLARILMNSVEESVSESYDMVPGCDNTTEDDTTDMTKDIVAESYTNPAYDHEDGARLIAMETAEALHDIFLESFYGMEQCDILAIRDGVALEGSYYAPIVENIITTTFKNIKETIIALWKKVVAFMNSILIYVEKFTKSGKVFFTKYDKEFSTLTNLVGFKFKMYDYRHEAIDNVPSAATYISDDDVTEIGGYVTRLLDAFSDPELQGCPEQEIIDSMDDIIKDFQVRNSDENIYAAHTGNDNIVIKDSKAYTEWVFGLFRNGAKPGEKQDIAITNAYSMIQIIKNFDPGITYRKLQSRTNTVYKDVLEQIDGITKKLEKSSAKNSTTVNSKIAEFLREESRALSKYQAATNIVLTGWKNVVKERDSAYKQMAMSALAYSRKNNK